jgi:hypothetical protein
MDQYVDHIVEPKRLLLAWQAPDHMGNRRRWVVGHVDVGSTPWQMSYLKGEGFEKANLHAAVPAHSKKVFAKRSCAGFHRDRAPTFRHTSRALDFGMQTG